MRRWIEILLVLTAASLVLHFLWETAQCPPFFIHGTYPAGMGATLRASLGDVGLTWVAYGAVALTSSDWKWVTDVWGVKRWLVISISALVLSIATESYALDSGLWSYTEINPRIPGTPISILPVAQLLLLFPASFGICRWILRKWGSNDRRRLLTTRSSR